MLKPETKKSSSKLLQRINNWAAVELTGVVSLLIRWAGLCDSQWPWGCLTGNQGSLACSECFSRALQLLISRIPMSSEGLYLPLESTDHGVAEDQDLWANYNLSNTCSVRHSVLPMSGKEECSSHPHETAPRQGWEGREPRGVICCLPPSV